MADPFIKATVDQAIASGQWIVQHRGTWQQYQQTLGLCATTVANYASQLILTDMPSRLLGV